MSDESVAHYRLKEPLGKGAMGEVWLAEDTRLHRPVALKRLPEAKADDEAAAARLLREARVASALSHPNVAVVYEVGEEEKDGRRRGFIAMEYVRGRTLAEMLKDGGTLEASAILPIARQIADALADAHEHGIVHRDVKPGNVMVTGRGLVKVLDFGLARFAPPAGEDSATWSGLHGAFEGTLAGTVAYMSPEQARGGPLDGRSDVFSLGVVLYELLSGRRPFTGRSTVEVLEAVLGRDPAPLALEGSLGGGLATLVSRMLEKDPGRRPAGMREVLSGIDSVAAGAGPGLPAGRDRTVAIVGFANITARADDAWLGAGLAETLAATLAEGPGLAVVAPGRVVEALRALGLSAADDSETAARVGREVGAASVVSGGYQCLADDVRVTARLIETATGKVTANVKVDGVRSAIFDLQDRIAAELATALRGSSPPGGARPEETQNLAAYEALSKGVLNLQTESQEAIDRAIVFFERAVALDPGYARAHMYLGCALDLKGDYLTTPELCERGLVALERAIALRPDFAEAWRYKGSALISVGRDEEALAAYEMALALNPTDASAQAGIGRVHFILRGDFARAVPAYERALALNPRGGWAALQLAHCATLLRDFPKAEAAARRAVELQQAFMSGRTGLVVVGAFMRLGHVFALQGRQGEALAEYGRELEFVKAMDHALRARLFIELHQRIGEAHLRLGEKEAAAASLDLSVEAWARRMRTGADDPMSPYYAACAHALRGEADEALFCLERAAARRPRLTAARARTEPALESLRDHARFRALVFRAPPPS